MTGLGERELSLRFESIGHNCEFGTVQRQFGAEPLGLLRFAGAVTHRLVAGLFAGFAGIGDEKTTEIFVSAPPESEYKVAELRYYLTYSTGQAASAVAREQVHKEQCRRLRFLRQKFVGDLCLGEKVFVLTRAEGLTEPEALAVYAALQMEGPNTLLWVTHGDPSRAGQVDELRPGFLHGHIGDVDDRLYGAPDAWLSLMANAFVFAQGGNDRPAGIRAVSDHVAS